MSFPPSAVSGRRFPLPVVVRPAPDRRPSKENFEAIVYADRHLHCRTKARATPHIGMGNLLLMLWHMSLPLHDVEAGRHVPRYAPVSASC